MLMILFFVCWQIALQLVRQGENIEPAVSQVVLPDKEKAESGSVSNETVEAEIVTTDSHSPDDQNPISFDRSGTPEVS